MNYYQPQTPWASQDHLHNLSSHQRPQFQEVYPTQPCKKEAQDRLELIPYLSQVLSILPAKEHKDAVSSQRPLKANKGLILESVLLGPLLLGPRRLGQVLQKEISQEEIPQEQVIVMLR